MYLPSHFEETRVEILHGLIRAHPLGALVTFDADGLNANHIPFEIDPDPGPLGTLRAHVARANPVWREFSGEVEPLVIFQGPHSYITPSWYQSKKETGKVVPHRIRPCHVCAQGSQRPGIGINFEWNMVCIQTVGIKGDQRAKRMGVDQPMQDFYASLFEM